MKTPISVPSDLSALRISTASMCEVLREASAQGFLEDADTATIFIDLSRFDNNIARLHSAFPSTTLHALAVKANPLVKLLSYASSLGIGAEVASIGEISLALAANFQPNQIVFDSPVKTSSELELALRLGLSINANSLPELARIGDLLPRHPTSSLIGVRINPEVGAGSIAATSVAAQHSKFGVSLTRHRTDLRDALSDMPWLTGLHVHIGSQGMSKRQLLDGIAVVYDFFLEAREISNLRRFNIGGGLPVPYRDDDSYISIETYASELQSHFPLLFSKDVSLVTEFGRAIHANCGWVASTIEYLTDTGDTLPTLYAHVGADMFLRKAYRPDDWHHDVSICTSNAESRYGDPQLFQIAGPLCFAGDFIDRCAMLPKDVRAGDYLLIHDAGAYTFGMWSVYNSRQMPKVLGYRDNGRTICLLNGRQPTTEIVHFWSRDVAATSENEASDVTT